MGKYIEKAYKGTGKGLQNLYGGIFQGRERTYGAEYPVGESFGRIMPLIGQIENEAGGIRERLFPAYQAALQRAQKPFAFKEYVRGPMNIPSEEALGLQFQAGTIPSEEALFGLSERRLRESLLPQLAASGLATSKGIDVLAPRISELATMLGERTFERGLSREQLRQVVGQQAFERGLNREQTQMLQAQMEQAFGQQAFGREMTEQANMRQALEGLKTLEILPTEIREKLIALIMGQPGAVPAVTQQPSLWSSIFGGGTTGSAASGVSSLFK